MLTDYDKYLILVGIMNTTDVKDFAAQDKLDKIMDRHWRQLQPFQRDVMAETGRFCHDMAQKVGRK